MVGGWGGIRTHETLTGLPVFKTGAFNRSATHPRGTMNYLGRTRSASVRRRSPRTPGYFVFCGGVVATIGVMLTIYEAITSVSVSRSSQPAGQSDASFFNSPSAEGKSRISR